MVDVDTGATFSAGTLENGTAGVLPIIHVW
jgi:hypothetical protein